MLAVGSSMARIDDESTVLQKQSDKKKKKRPPERKCGDWCEFLSSKGSIYYYNVKRGKTQWKKPDAWDDINAYEPKSKKKARIEEAEETKRILGLKNDEKPLLNGTTPLLQNGTITDQVKKRSSTILENYRRKKLELENQNQRAERIDQKFSIEALREQQLVRRQMLLERLDDFKLPPVETLHPPLHNMIKYVNNETLGSELREIVFDKAEHKSNRICRERSKLDRERFSQSAQIARLKRNLKLIETESTILTTRSSALSLREEDVLNKMTGKISTYNSLK